MKTAVIFTSLKANHLFILMCPEQHSPGIVVFQFQPTIYSIV